MRRLVFWLKLMHRPVPTSALLLAAGLLTLPAAAADFSRCTVLSDDQQRLRCYDELAHSATPTASQNLPAAATSAPAPLGNNVENPPFPPADSNDGRSYLTRAWNLDGRSGRTSNNFARLRPHRTSYFMVRETSRTNPLPNTPSPGHTALTPLTINDFETKFQISFKSEIWGQDDSHWLGFENLHLWAAYTQQSSWQAFTPSNSSPFRESNYEPEVIATFGTGNSDGLKLINLGFVHQSNGQSLPLSRSWNRLYAQGGWEWGKFSMLGRGWWRIPENAQQDDNPDITKYLGVADLVLRWEPNKVESVTLLVRNNLRLNQNLGFMQLDWATPVQLGNFAKLHAQLTSGFGESMIDYNHRQTTIGLGVSFRDW